MCFPVVRNVDCFQRVFGGRESGVLLGTFGSGVWLSGFPNPTPISDPISYPESSGFLVSGWAPGETRYGNFVTAGFLR